MKTDVLIIGSELDAYVAAIRLEELGISSRIITNGKGSSIYSMGDIKVLRSYENRCPFKSFGQLNKDHPYNLIGLEKVKQSINWFFEKDIINELGYKMFEKNKDTISPIGLRIPSYGGYRNLASFDEIKDKNVAIFKFDGHKDFHSELISNSIQDYVSSIKLIEINKPLPNLSSDNSGIAQSFDKLTNPNEYFFNIKNKINNEFDVLLFPAVLGIRNHIKIMESANKILSIKCLEVPTLPPSIPSIRLSKSIEREILKKSNIHHGSFVIGTNVQNNICESIIDNSKRTINAKAFIVANGGILMGGLKVRSDGEVIEELFNSKTIFKAHMSSNKSYESINALQDSGVLTDENLNPTNKDNIKLKNIFFTGRNLANWNPSLEFSSEGVSIASGWHSANNVFNYLGY